MRSLLLLRVGFAALLALAVALKVGAKGAVEAPALDFGAAMVQAMTDHGFQVIASRDGLLPIVEARTATCGISVASLSPLGYGWDVFRRSAPAGMNVFVTYGGRRYEEQPRWRTTFDFYWTRLNRVVGRLVAQGPVLGIASSESCQRGEIEWLDRPLLTVYGT